MMCPRQHVFLRSGVKCLRFFPGPAHRSIQLVKHRFTPRRVPDACPAIQVQEALETQKEEFARREELFKRRQEALRKQDLELQQQLIRFNKFLQENDSKTARAEKKAAEEIKQREQKEKEIQELTVQVHPAHV